MKGDSEGRDPSTTNVLVLLQPLFSNSQVSFLSFKPIHRWDSEQTIHQCAVSKTLWEKQKHDHSYGRQSTGNSTSFVICFGGTRFSHAVIQEAFNSNREYFRRQNQNHSRLYQSYNLFKYMYNSSYALLYSRYFIYLLCGRCLLYLQWNSVTTNKNIDFTKIHRRAVTHKHHFFFFFFMSCKDTEKCSCA